MFASYIEALLHKDGIHWNNNGSVGNKDDMGDGATITYSFIGDNLDDLDEDRYRDFATFSDEQQEAIRSALAHYEEVANIKFQAVDNDGTLQLGYAETFYDWNGDGEIQDTEGAGGLATRPRDSGATVVIDRGNTALTPGTRGYNIVLHELGHAVGGFNDVTIGRNPGNQYTERDERRNRGMNDRTLGAWQDNNKYTLMSYMGHPNMPGFQPRTLMLYDIAALQALYGANWNHNADDTTYSWGLNESFIETIWDGGGVDTIDVSNQTRRSILDLRAGSFSSIGSYLYGTKERNNLAIAYGVTIENAIGGSGNDTIRGNSARNRIEGRSGNDEIYSFAGNDTIYGGEGDDYISAGNDNDYIFGEIGNDYISAGDGNDILNGGLGIDHMFGGEGNDAYYVDHLDDVVIESVGNGHDGVISSVNYTLGAHLEDLRITGTVIQGWGNNLNNTIFGNSENNSIKGVAGNDILYGYQGDDTFWGDDGNDTIYGGDGNDTAYGYTEDDFLNGEDGHDKLYGQQGKDTLLGLAGNDILSGGDGDDILHGYGRGMLEIDRLAGGSGADLFILGESPISEFVWLPNVGAFYKGTFGNQGLISTVSTAKTDLINAHKLPYQVTTMLGSLTVNIGDITRLDGYAIIEDFNRGEGDKLQILGSRNDYSVTQQNVLGSSAPDTVISFAGTNDKLAILQDTTNFSAIADFVSVA
ncbi:M10 family metallopeptidase C-terminal domain-containing protein [Leptothoe spongobia]|uniref:M10 family metallopeptidase C-terminal domain-containing protein n=1 Tax=Leptothoe spongobia TAU-MAC 1115 TaxID=1967444 RepID=A0A947DHW5_9CYAN|nr:M10 family metallopeptidase C-terminal domain-containing protein [Leptothoe spongobia]MBT9316236.1 M10 family metallopeptidase C-terminal domain-containing protein [Leptothoe spongobia TAU-MAC 1115]